MFSWRGSAGARSSDIERAEEPTGPWSRLAENQSDAVVAYRPLFTDTTATPGKNYYYRVFAQNESGVSKPSNVVGPVLIKQLCLVDEFLDFTKITNQSGKISISNDYSALYTEYLFRAKAEEGASLSYGVPGSINSVKITAFFDKQVADPTLEVSADGNTYSTLKPERTERILPGTPGGAFAGKTRTMVTYECPVPAGNTRFKITLNAPTEHDRVEIHHQ
ncbi:MAG: hypothetical protein H8M99_02755 [Gloeobacteraceae cyanobacterium ES-bin-144]|nr:hypothetical protein [Verrucomicrobiales bacterium]